MQYVCDIDRDCKATGVVCVTCMVLRNTKWRLTFKLTTGRDREIAGLILLFR